MFRNIIGIAVIGLIVIIIAPACMKAGKKLAKYFKAL